MDRGAARAEHLTRPGGAVITVAAVAALIALAAGAAWLATSSVFALRVLWIAGPIALTAGGFAVLQLVLPKD